MRALLNWLASTLGFPQGVTTVSPAPPPLAHDMETVRFLATTGQKIPAIKIYRELAHCDLKDAHDAVERIAAGESVTLPSRPAPAGPADPRILELVRQKNLIEAIKLYREVHGTDLKTAKDAVERLAAS